MISSRTAMTVLVLCAASAVPAAAADDWPICNNYKDQPTAIAACTRMIREGTFKPMTWVYCARGVAYIWSHKYDRAIADLDEGLARDPKNSICTGQLGIAYLMKGDRERAIEEFKRAIELDPDNETARNELKKLQPESSGRRGTGSN